MYPLVFFVICLNLLYVLLLDTFLKCLILLRNAEMRHLDGFVPIWKMKTQINVIFKNDSRLR